MIAHHDASPHPLPSRRHMLSVGLRPAPGFQVLSEREIRIVEAVGETLFPGTGRLELSAADAGIAHYLDDIFAAVPRKERLLLRCLLVLFDVQLLLTWPTAASRFSSASLSVRTTSLEGWEQSDLYARRAAFQALRSLVLWAYVDNPEVAGAMGVRSGTEIIADRLQRELNRAEADVAARRGVGSASA